MLKRLGGWKETVTRKPLKPLSLVLRRAADEVKQELDSGVMVMYVNNPAPSTPTRLLTPLFPASPFLVWGLF